MKKMILAALFVCGSLVAQKNSLSLTTTFSQPTDLGFTYERFLKGKEGEDKNSRLFSAGLSGMTYKVQDYEFSGSGFYVASGSRSYFNNTAHSGFYLENYLIYSSLSFDDVDWPASIKGKYSYFSMINPTAGYKFMIGKNLSINPYAGMNWKWEIKGTEDIDNKEVDNLVFRLGLSIGYQF